jgi:peptidoglycan/LPS O-acetylase OafA/YrhL
MAAEENVSLNLLRAGAAVLVVAGHSRNFLFRDWSVVPHTVFNRAFYTLGSLQHSAVMVFFVLSGYFVGGHILARSTAGTFDWRSYAVARLTRLWVVLLPALVVTAVCGGVALLVVPHASITVGSPLYSLGLPAHLAHALSPLRALENVAFLQDIHGHVYGNNGPLWSLAFEFWYYVAGPLLIVGVVTRSGTGVALVAGLCIVLAFVGPDAAKYFVVWLFGLGVAIGAPRVPPLVRTGPIQCVGVVVLLAAMVADKARPGFASDALLGLIAAALITSLIEDAKFPIRIRGSVTRVSRYAHSSYSLYAIHFPIAALAAAVLIPSVVNRWAPSALHLAAYIAFVAALIVIAWAFAWATERRTDAVRRRALAATSVRPVAAANT